MKLIKSIDRPDLSLNLRQYPDQNYAVSYYLNGKTRRTILLVYLSDALEIFDGIFDHYQTGELE